PSELPTEHRHEVPGDPEEERADDRVDEVHHVVRDVDLQAAENALDVQAEERGGCDDGDDVKAVDDDVSDEAGAEVMDGHGGAGDGHQKSGHDAGERALE